MAGPQFIVQYQPSMNFEQSPQRGSSRGGPNAIGEIKMIPLPE